MLCPCTEERSLRFLKIAVNEKDEERVLAGRRLRLNFSTNTIAYERALVALLAVTTPRGMPDYTMLHRAEEMHSCENVPCSEHSYSPLQRALVGISDGGGTLESIACIPPPWSGDIAIPSTCPGGLEVVLVDTTVGLLNASQQIAVKRALGRTLSLWQPPPGTGKTRTLMAFIEAAVAVAAVQGFGTGGVGDAGASAVNDDGGGVDVVIGPVVLACAASNVAVDNIVVGSYRGSVSHTGVFDVPIVDPDLTERGLSF